MKNYRDLEVTQANEDITKYINNLYQIMSHMDSSKRELVKTYLIMGKGIQIFNEIGVFVKKMYRKADCHVNLNKNESYNLAEKLEHWFKDYKELWRSHGKEAELYRITEIIIWYGDLLRS